MKRWPTGFHLEPRGQKFKMHKEEGNQMLALTHLRIVASVAYEVLTMCY